MQSPENTFRESNIRFNLWVFTGSSTLLGAFSPTRIKERVWQHGEITNLYPAEMNLQRQIFFSNSRSKLSHEQLSQNKYVFAAEFDINLLPENLFSSTASFEEITLNYLVCEIDKILTYADNCNYFRVIWPELLRYELYEYVKVAFWPLEGCTDWPTTATKAQWLRPGWQFDPSRNGESPCGDETSKVQ